MESRLTLVEVRVARAPWSDPVVLVPRLDRATYLRDAVVERDGRRYLVHNSGFDEAGLPQYVYHRALTPNEPAPEEVFTTGKNPNKTGLWDIVSRDEPPRR